MRRCARESERTLKNVNARFTAAVLVLLFIVSGTAYAEPLLPETSKRQATAPAKKSSKSATSQAPAQSFEEREKLTIKQFIYMLDDANARLQYLQAGGEADCAECIAATAGTSNSTLETPDKARVCIQTWNRFYSKDVVDLNIVFGYFESDEDDIARDTDLRKAMIHEVTKRCPIEQNDFVRACGFRRSADDEDVFEKKVPGPTGKTHLVRLRLTASSFSASERVNRLLNEQQAQSDHAESVFYDAMPEVAMNVYVGHARGGGGPSYGPALRNKAGKIDYERYRKEKPGLKKLLDRLRNATKTPQLLSLLACESSVWDGTVSRAAPKSGVLLSETPLVPVEVNLAQAYNLLDSVLWQRCEDAFNKALNGFSSYDGQSIIPLKIKNFFHADPEQ